MAVNVEWQVKPPGKKGDEPQMYPRITDCEVIGEERLSKLMAARGTLSQGMALAALSDLAEVMAELLSDGKAVNIPALGSFKLSIGSDAEIHPNSDGRMRSVVLRGVNFQPSNELMDGIGKPTFKWRPATGMAIAPSVDQLLPKLEQYFQTRDSITRAEFEQMYGLKRTTAYDRLKKLEEAGVIQAVGHGPGTVYKKVGQ